MRTNQNLPFLAAFSGMVSVQTGAAFAKTLFPVVGSEGVAALRLGISAVILLVVFRPWTLCKNEISWSAITLYGTVLALMNLLIYRAFSYIPVSIAISIEVMGPLTVALFTSRQKIDLLWILLSAFGMFLLAAGDIHNAIDIRGVAYSLAAAMFWGLYIIIGRRVSGGGGRSVAAGMTVAALIAVPLGTAQAGVTLLMPGVLLTGICVALLSSMLPFLLDMYAMRLLPSRVFGVLLSGSPAVSAFAGWIILHEELSLTQCSGILSVMAACTGCSLFARRRKLPYGDA
ncbi:EamA family transporter [Pectobacterium brasiliense]|uniref:EamA family transporter n=1 Tax=Pectobacterium TaxID=122277 RepID=UPI0001A42C8B|nr:MULTISPECIES: EamA family transporter [Pectobacterium]EKU2182053.1 EamA family transporter [Citrobacter freundii]EKV4364392.1 EamA family transporter [Citrobacter freundii]MCA5919130.1 EamA family transporter [Pectobacterium brasiliense]MCA5925575.1 EamA family transporter [Pectobacterium brasiliense]MCA5934994.1 EamA family transporter [Pectobacterium brasiliense]